MTEDEIDYNEELESGKYLFKFCKFDVNALQIIINKTLYFCAPNKLNDPLDSSFDLEIENPENFSAKTREYIRHPGFPINERVKFLVRDVGLEMGEVDKQKELLKEFINDMQNRFVGICSFSTRAFDQNTMWSHYANEAKGVCLVFDKEQLTKSLLDNRLRNYRMVKERVDYDGIKLLRVEINEEGEAIGNVEHLFTKTKHWSGEEEYRIILELNPDIYNSNVFDPFLNFDDKCLKFIIAGQRIEEKHLEMLERLGSQKCFEATLLKHTFDR